MVAYVLEVPSKFSDNREDWKILKNSREVYGYAYFQPFTFKHCTYCVYFIKSPSNFFLSEGFNVGYLFMYFKAITWKAFLCFWRKNDSSVMGVTTEKTAIALYEPCIRVNEAGH